MLPIKRLKSKRVWVQVKKSTSQNKIPQVKIIHLKHEDPNPTWKDVRGGIAYIIIAISFWVTFTTAMAFLLHIILC